MPGQGTKISGLTPHSPTGEMQAYTKSIDSLGVGVKIHGNEFGPTEKHICCRGLHDRQACRVNEVEESLLQRNKQLADRLDLPVENR